MTGQLQVLDVVVNKPFKDNLRKRYTAWLLAGDHALTPTGKIKKPEVRALCEWILQAWNEVSSESIINGFKKCCVSNAMDGSEDDVLWEEGQPAGQDDRSDESDVCSHMGHGTSVGHFNFVLHVFLQFKSPQMG